MHDLPLALGQPRQKRPQLLAGDGVDDVLVSCGREGVLEQISECSELASGVHDRLVQTARPCVGADQSLRLLELDVRPVGELADLGRAALALVDALVFRFQLRELAKRFRR